MKDKKTSNSKKEKNHRDSLPFRVIIKNCTWALSLIHKTVPGIIALKITIAIVSTVLEFFVGTYLFRHILNSYQAGNQTLPSVIIFIAGIYLFYLIFNFSVSLITNLFYPKTDMKIEKKVTKMILNKAAECDLECYENPEFYDKYVRAMDHGYQSITAVQNSLIKLINTVLSVILNGSLMLIIDPTLLIFTVFPIFFGMLRKRELEWYYKYVRFQKPMFDSGSIIESGSHNALMEKGGKYAEMFIMQAKKYAFSKIDFKQ